MPDVTTTPTTTAAPSGTTPATTVPNISAQETTVSNYAAPYVKDMLGKAQGVANSPYQAYTGELTAGPSDLQKAAFTGIGNLTLPTGFDQASAGLTNLAGSTFGNAQAAQYMNPYLEASLNPQLALLQRQNEIQRLQDQSRLSQAGAYGGGRQAVMQGQNNLNTGLLQSKMIGEGYNTAYNNAMSQYNADMNRQLQANQGLGGLANTQNQANLANLQAQQTAGGIQRDIQQQADTAAQNQFNEQRDYPKTQLEFQQKMLQGLPLTTTNYYSPPQTLFNSAITGGGNAVDFLKGIFPSWFNTSTSTTTAPTTAP
jgi:hypothetical protein